MSDPWRPAPNTYDAQVVDAVQQRLSEIGPHVARGLLFEPTDTTPPEERASAAEKIEALCQEEADRKAYRRAKGAENAKRRIAEEKAADLPRAWAHEDLAEAWEEAETETRTDVGALRDVAGECLYGLFYSSKVNGVHAGPEAGKSWLLCLAGVQEISKGRHVAYIDFEDDKKSIVQRLRLLGASREAVLTYFRYHQPVGPLTEADMEDFAALVAMRGSLAVFDGMTEAMALEGLDDKTGTDVATWHAKYTKPFAAAGWAAVVADHIPLTEKRVIGSQHKKSIISGVSYLLDPVAPIGKGLRGVSRLKVEKDRCGWIRKNARPGRTPQYFASLVVDFGVFAARPEANVWVADPAPQTEDSGYDAPSEKLCRTVLAYVTEHPESSTKTDIRSAVKGNSGAIGRCVDWLVFRRHLTPEPKDRRTLHVPGPESFDKPDGEAAGSSWPEAAETLFDQVE
ncbi:hypothetical protein [Streptomyces sp. MZ04]|uniref:hypothetical protein n=1 Tax=Streptomyces sp. MZ04 TaxID=2559236 RepID=UPI00107ECF1C|nr:hypothetical protein [Streptomyces sp. MZ04]TGB12617.1 hypothetical protein E2651_11575 [Streptomyces sp. MZ04]